MAEWLPMKALHLGSRGCQCNFGLDSNLLPHVFSLGVVSSLDEMKSQGPRCWKACAR